MNEKDVRALVRTWALGVLGTEIIHAWPNADAPAEPYAVLTRVARGPVTDNPAGVDYEPSGSKVLQIPILETYWRFAIDVFGPDPEGVLRKIETAWNVPTAMWPLRPLILAEVSRITTENEIRDQSWKGRAQVTVEVRTMVRDGLLIDVIEKQTPEFERV